VYVDDEPWFIAKDICDALELSNITTVLKRIDDDEISKYKISTSGGLQTLNIVSIAGLYSVILGCRKLVARPFKRWVTHDVIPYVMRNRLLQLELEMRKNEPLPSSSKVDRVYIASSDSYASESIYKIGYTSNVKARLSQMNTSHTKDDSMRIIQTWNTENGATLEKQVHAELDGYRLSHDREFFKVPITLIVDVITKCLSAQASST